MSVREIFDTKTDTEEVARQLAFIEEGRKIVAELSEKAGRKLTACVVTFGCQMNARDSEKLSGILKKMGYVLTEDENSDFVLYNTCTVRDNANQKVYGKLGTLNAYKKRNKLMKIALCGCMTQEEVVIEKIQKSYSFVDLVFGTHNLYAFPELFVQMMQRDLMIVDIWESTTKIVEDLPIVRKYPFKSGVNIMFGCDKFCTYCIVPYVRGRERSREPEEIICEIKNLVKDGVKEVMLLGQNVNSYGKNLPEKTTFPELLHMIEQIEGLERIRFMTPYPSDFGDDMIEVMKNSTKICKHIHLPLQSGSSRILKRMNRRYTKEQFLDLALKLRKELPDVALTTDIIVGFPGETKEDIDETLDVIRKVQFDNAFTFIYSKRTGTPAASMPDQVAETDIKVWFDEVLSLVQQCAKDRTAMLQDQVADVLVEGINEHDASLVTGRMSNNTLVHFPGDKSLIGQIVKVSLDECRGFYYLGKRV
ncbi:MAG: tRNA (N6-isopentenyl adenosine(37)-C2)-methylthiotransferase MiaB [Lachnospiraceae bacterium]|nr:tRNA (N6-isopentenyl adenosine(37)-C2)-methylthiotransferase MiaB [Lachnospiraceae bacterium]